MSDIKVTYIAPPAPPPGRVTIELDLETAAKLRALLGNCTGSVFDDLHQHLQYALPEPWNHLMLRIGQDASTAASSICLHPASGAKFY